MAETEERSGPIYMLVNCAGMALFGFNLSVDDDRQTMDYNYFGTLMPIKYVLPKMKKAQEGIIVITAYQYARHGRVGLGSHTACRNALCNLAEGLAQEVGNLGVTIVLASPIETDTPGFVNEQKMKIIALSSKDERFQHEEVSKRILDDALVGFVYFSIFCVFNSLFFKL